MAIGPENVKKSATKRFRVTLRKRVMVEMSTVVEVSAEVPMTETTQRDRIKRSSAVVRAVKAKLAVERCNDIEREWQTEPMKEIRQDEWEESSIEEI